MICVDLHSNRAIDKYLGNKFIQFMRPFTPFLISPKGERFCSFPPGGRLGWGSKG